MLKCMKSLCLIVVNVNQVIFILLPHWLPHSVFLSFCSSFSLNIVPSPFVSFYIKVLCTSGSVVIENTLLHSIVHNYFHCSFFSHISFLCFKTKSQISFYSVHFTVGVIRKTDSNKLVPLVTFAVIGFLFCCLLILVRLPETYYVVLTSLLINIDIKTEENSKANRKCNGWSM